MLDLACAESRKWCGSQAKSSLAKRSFGLLAEQNIDLRLCPTLIWAEVHRIVLNGYVPTLLQRCVVLWSVLKCRGSYCYPSSAWYC